MTTPLPNTRAQRLAPQLAQIADWILAPHEGALKVFRQDGVSVRWSTHWEPARASYYVDLAFFDADREAFLRVAHRAATLMRTIGSLEDTLQSWLRPGGQPLIGQFPIPRLDLARARGLLPQLRGVLESIEQPPEALLSVLAREHVFVAWTADWDPAARPSYWIDLRVDHSVREGRIEPIARAFGRGETLAETLAAVRAKLVDAGREG